MIDHVYGGINLFNYFNILATSYLKTHCKIILFFKNGIIWFFD
jgi:hypothetical protein